MKAGAVIQARMGSTRLPGKALLEIEGVSMLARVVDRVRRMETVDRIVVATTTGTHDDPLAQHAAVLGVDVYRGDEEDVLDRYYQAARLFNLGVVVRITSDCPLLDPGLADQVVRLVLTGSPRPDYAANTISRSYPRGLDVEVVPLATLERAWREATSSHERAHVFPYVYEHPETFSVAGVADAVDRSAMRWTVDTEDDLTFVREVYRRLAGREITWTDVLNVLQAEPQLLRINAQVRQKSAHQR